MGSKKDDIQKKINSLQAELAILSRVPDDTFSFGTVALFSASSGAKWYYVKTDEESWRSFQRSQTETLEYWIDEAINSAVGYFEVYIMTPANKPIFTSS